MYNEVRIYAIPPKNFKDAAEFRDYLLKKLPRQRYIFYFEKHGIRCKDNTLIYFQYDNYIIAKAVVVTRIKLKLYLKKGTVELAHRKVLTCELGVNWFPEGDPIRSRLLNNHVQKGPLFIDPDDAQIIDNKCF